jgi:hypothetical protein
MTAPNNQLARIQRPTDNSLWHSSDAPQAAENFNDKRQAAIGPADNRRIYLGRDVDQRKAGRNPSTRPRLVFVSVRT